jgi:hypothetical protein
LKKKRSVGMCYSHFGNGVRNGAISITQWGFIMDRHKVNPIGQWGKILLIEMGFVDHLGHVYLYGLWRRGRSLTTLTRRGG